jgi:putative transposase
LLKRSDRRDSFTYYRWRKEFGGLKSGSGEAAPREGDERLRKAVSDPTLEKLILREAASENF